MIDTATDKGRLIDAALRLAAERPWSEVTLLDIGEAAGMTLAEVRKVAGSKSQIVAAFMRLIDDRVLAQKTPRTPGQPARDALFDVLMARFDAMAPYKPALASIAAAGQVDTTLIMPFLNSQRWMMAAAGIDADGVSGLARTTGLAAVYGRAFNIWLSDDDPGMARTMAALDGSLRRGERTLGTLDAVFGGAARVARDLPGVLRDVMTRGRAPRTAPPEPPPQDPRA